MQVNPIMQYKSKQNTITYFYYQFCRSLKIDLNNITRRRRINGTIHMKILLGKASAKNPTLLYYHTWWKYIGIIQSLSSHSQPALSTILTDAHRKSWLLSSLPLYPPSSYFLALFLVDDSLLPSGKPSSKTMQSSRINT